MAVINYTMQVLPVGTDNEDVELSAVSPSTTLPPTIGAPITGTNLLTSDTGIYYLNASTEILDAFTINDPVVTWSDAVYKLDIDSYIADNSDSITFTDVYFLKTVTLDAGIASFPSVLRLDINIKAALVSGRTGIQTNFNTAVYADANDGISLNNGIISATRDTTSLTCSISLISATTIRLTVNDTTFANNFSVLGSTLTNLLDGTVVNISSTVFVAGSAVDQNFNLLSTGTYPARWADGVYEVSIGALDQISENTSGDIYEGVPAYALVTTELDLGIALYQAQHDSTNAAQAAILVQLLALQTSVDTEFAAEDYDATNQAIEDIFDLLGTGLIWSNVGAVLTDKSNMTVTFTSLPSGTYSDGQGTVTNTMTLEEYGYTGFPANSSDLTDILNSVTLGAGDDYPDGVYQIAGSFLVDGVLFTYEVYVLVITDIYCGYDKIVAKASTCKFSASLQLKIQSEINMIENCFQRGDYVTANTHIRIATQMLSQSGCGCGCS